MHVQNFVVMWHSFWKNEYLVKKKKKLKKKKKIIVVSFGEKYEKPWWNSQKV